MTLVMPPKKLPKRTRPWHVFERLYEPITHDDGCLLWSLAEERRKLAIGAIDIRNTWTVVQGDSGDLIVLAGPHIVNRLDYLITTQGWAEEPDQHPAYLYATE